MPLLIAAITTSVWAVVVSTAPVVALALAIWGTGGEPGPAVTEVLRFAGDVWLLAHGVPLSYPGGHVSLAPLLLTGLVCWRLIRAGANAVRTTGARHLASGVQLVVGIALCYGVLGAAISVVARTSVFTANPLAAGVIAGGVGALCAGVGVARENGALRFWWRRAPAWVSNSLVTALLSLVSMFAVSAALTGVALAIANSRARGLLESYQPSIAAMAGMCVLSLLYLPSATVWAMAYLAGPGFALGADTAVSAWRVHTGPVPAFPLLATVPETRLAPGLGVAMVAVPIVIGVVAGIVLARQSLLGNVRVVLTAALGGLFAGAGAALLAIGASGGFGGDRLAELGPSWWLVGVVVAAQVGAGAIAGAAAVRLLPLLRRLPALLRPRLSGSGRG